MSRSKWMQTSAVLLAVQSLAGAAVPLKIVGFDDMSCSAWSASKDDTEQRALYVA